MSSLHGPHGLRLLAVLAVGTAAATCDGGEEPGNYQMGRRQAKLPGCGHTSGKQLSEVVVKIVERRGDCTVSTPDVEI
jgi:hypothetical protein